MPTTPFIGMPGVKSLRSATPRRIFLTDEGRVYLPSIQSIDGTLSRDPGNTGDLPVLRPGLLMGKITASGKYAPSVLGVTTAAYTSGGTTLNVSAAQATEIARRVGASGSLYAVGPPSAAGSVAVTSVTYSAIDTTTGDITCTSLGVNKIAGTLLAATDGTHLPITLIPDGYGVVVTDTDGTTSLDVPFPQFPIAGVITASQLLPVWPSDTSLRAWVRDQLNTYGKFVLDYGY